MLENQLSDRLSLNGVWQFVPDTPPISANPGTIQVPGAWEAQGYRTDAAVYRRTVEIPLTWAGARIALRFGAVSYITDVSVNGTPVGGHKGLWTAHEFDVTTALRPGQMNEIDVHVRKPSALDSGEGSYRTTLVGFIPYVATTFGGLWQEVELIAHRAPAFERLVVQTSIDLAATGTVERATIVIQGKVLGLGYGVPDSDLLIDVIAPDGTVIAQHHDHRADLAADVPIHLSIDVPTDRLLLWQPDSPALYTVRVRLEQGGQVAALATRRVGFRELSTQEDRVLLNGVPFSVRGILHWGWNPDTLAPLFTDEQIRAEFQRVRALGFNLVKLCLFVPPDRLFELADEAGMLLWLELPLWWQRMTDHLRAQTSVEYADIMQQVQQHPAVVIYSLGCELDAQMLDAPLASALNAIVRHQTTGCLLCDNSGSGEAYGGLKLDLADFSDYHFYADIQYFVPLCDHFRRDWTPPRPWIFGEYCDADDFRDLSELSANGQRPAWLDYQGVEGNPTRWAYGEQNERIAALHLPLTNQQLQTISRQQSFAVRKNIIEKTRARRGMGGYVLTGLRDTPIMTSGVFDDLNRPKYDAGAFRAFNAETVLLLERGRSRQWTLGGDRPAPLDRYNVRSGAVSTFRVVVSHSGAAISGGRLRWRLIGATGKLVLEGERTLDGTIQGGIPREAATIDLNLPPVAHAETWTLTAELDGISANAWLLWVYPPVEPLLGRVTVYGRRLRELGLGLPPFEHPIAPYGDVIITDVLDPVITSALDKGARAIVMALDANSPLMTQPVPFWRESIKLIHQHAAWGDFPQQGFVDMQFYHLAPERAFSAAPLPGTQAVRPIMQRLDARLFSLLDYVVEYELPHTRVIASTLNLFGGMGDQVLGFQANIAAQYLLSQWVGYLRDLPL